MRWYENLWDLAKNILGGIIGLAVFSLIIYGIQLLLSKFSGG